MVARLLVPGHRSAARRARISRSRKAPSRRAPTWCVSTSPTATTRSICSPRSNTRRIVSPSLRRCLLGTAGALPSRGVATADPQVRAANLTALQAAPQVQGTLTGEGPCSCSRTAARRVCSRRASHSRASRSRSPSSPSAPTAATIRRARGFSRRSRVWRSSVRQVARKLGLDFVSVASRPRGGEARDARTAARPVGAVGGHRHDRLGALHARSAPHTVRLRARRGHPRRPAEGQVRRAALRARRSRAGRADRGAPQGLGADAVQEDRLPRRVWALRPQSDDITGGIGYAGLAELQKFRRAREDCSSRSATARCCPSRAAWCAACAARPAACRAPPEVAAPRRPPPRPHRPRPRGRMCGCRSRDRSIRLPMDIRAHTLVFRQNYALYSLPRTLAAHGVLHHLS